MYTVISSKNRIEWLNQRRSRPTATDIARVWAAGCSPLSILTIAHEKAQPPREISAPALDYGHAREPYLIEYAAKHFPDENIKANDQLCINDDDDSVAATPDGIGDNCIVECKTHGADDRTEPTVEHIAQMNIIMYVLGKPRAIYVCEIHQGYVTKRIWHTIVERDDELIAKLLGVGAKIREAMDAEDVDEDVEKTMDGIIEEYAALKAAENEIKKRIESVTNRVVTMVGTDYAFKSASGKGSVTTSDKIKRTADAETIAKVAGDRADDILAAVTVTTVKESIDLDRLERLFPDVAERAIDVTVTTTARISQSKKVRENASTKGILADEMTGFSSDNPFT